MFKRSLLSFLILFFASPQLWATRMDEKQWTFDSFLYGEEDHIASSQPNPGNAVLQQPHTTYILDNRLDFKWLLNDGKLIARPRWTFSQTKIKNDLTGQENSSARGKVDVTDAFWEQVWTRKASTTVGLQVYQWGPGELFNPSNPFFRFNNQQQSFTFKEKGKVLARANYSFDMEHSLVFISEPISNNEAYWMEEKSFQPQVALKYERNWKNTRNYYGLIGGTEAQQNQFIGEYAFYEFKPGFSVYVDAKHSYELAHYAPKSNATGSYDMQLVGEHSHEFSHIALAGFRYEGDVDFRIEYLYNSAGYTRSDYDAAISSVSNFFSPYYVQNAKRFLNSGLNLATQNYLYLSLRVSEPAKIKDFSVYLRTLNALADSSGLVQAEFDKAIGGSFVGFGSYSVFTGKENSEFHLLDDWRVLLGVKYTL